MNDPARLTRLWEAQALVRRLEREREREEVQRLLAIINDNVRNARAVLESQKCAR
jgi:uncharacterized protein (UPF0297 family)